MWNTIKLNRTLLLLFLFVSVNIHGQVSIYPYTEDFDAAVDATTTNTPNGSGNPVTLTKTGGNAGKCAGIDFQIGSTKDSWFWIYFSATAGNVYDIKFDENKCTNITCYITATKTTAAASATLPIYTQNSYSNLWNRRASSTWTAPTSGNYYVAFKIVNGTVYTGRIDNITLTESITVPIELLYFKVNSNCSSELISKWGTASEFNVWKYIIMYSLDDNTYIPVDSIEDIGYSSVDRNYEMQSSLAVDGCIVYVKLREIDYDGYKKDFEPESVYIPKRCKRGSSGREELYRYNIFGQIVDETYNGFVIILYSDNTTEYKIN